MFDWNNQLGSCLEKKLRLADRDSCKAQISKVTEDVWNEQEYRFKNFVAHFKNKQEYFKPK